MASRTLSFPPVSIRGTRSGPPRRSTVQSSSRRLDPRLCPTSRISQGSGTKARLHLVDRFTEQVRYRPAPSPAVQARRVAAQVEWEIARQAGRHTRPQRPAGTLILLPVEVVRPSARERAVGMLRRLFGGQKPLLSA